MLPRSPEPRRPGTDFLRAETPEPSPGSCLARSASPPWSRGRPPGARESPLGRRPCLRESPSLVPRTPATTVSAGAVRGPSVISRRPPRIWGKCGPSRRRSRPPRTPAALPLPRPSGTGGGCPEERGCTSPRPERTSPVAPTRPFLHAAVLQHFRHRGGKAAAIPNTTPASACDSSAWIPPAPNCLPGVFLAAAVRCLSLVFPREKMD